MERSQDDQRAFLAPGTTHSPDRAFACLLKDLRRRVVGKQLALSSAVGCTEAAVSFWESGKRLPIRAMFTRILVALATGGASRAELEGLRECWIYAVVT